MEHRGEILRDIIKESGMTQRAMARKLNVHHNTLANYFDQADLSLDIVLRAGEILGVDVTKRLPSLQRVVGPATEASFPPLQEPVLSYMTNAAAPIPETLPACQLALMQLQQKHISLLTDFLNLVRQQQHAA